MRISTFCMYAMWCGLHQPLCPSMWKSHNKLPQCENTHFVHLGQVQSARTRSLGKGHSPFLDTVKHVKIFAQQKQMFKGILTQRGMLVLKDVLGKVGAHQGNVGAHRWHSRSVQQWQLASMLRPEIFVTELCVTCHAVTVTIFDLHHPNKLFYYHILKVTCLFGSDTL